LVLAQEGSGGSGASFVLTLVLMLGAMYLLIIRPQRKRIRAVVQAQAGLVAGSEVVLTSGIYGTAVNVDKETVLLEVAPGVLVKVARAAIGQVVTPEAAAAEPDVGTPPG
jgi:preprotein translocase subunit YajC